MTTRDTQCIWNLYYIHRYIPSTIARLYGVTPKHILTIVHQTKDQSVTAISDLECILCGLEDSEPYYIDGDSGNHKPQNVIQLCEADKRRLKHMQLRKRKGSLEPQF